MQTLSDAWRRFAPGFCASQVPVPRAMCRAAITSSAISHRIQYRPTRSIRRLGPGRAGVGLPVDGV